MKVDIEDVLFWMDAVRNSEDKYRTLESFWKGQVHSKLWLIENLEKFVADKHNNIVIHGGWNGVLAALLFNSHIPVNHITSVDIDPRCEEIAKTINKRYQMQGKFTAITKDMALYEYKNQPDIVINTSSEHVTDEVLSVWKKQIPKNSLIVVQNNNFTALDEHINCVKSLNQLSKKINLNILIEKELPMPMYTRFMVIGYNNV